MQDTQDLEDVLTPAPNCGLTEEEIKEVEARMEKTIERRNMLSDIITVCILIVIFLSVFFPDALKSIYHMILKVTEWI